MHCFCTSIRLSSMQFPWYAAGTQNLRTLKHERQINVCLFLLHVLASPLNLFAGPASSVHSNTDANPSTPSCLFNFSFMGLYVKTNSTPVWACPPPAGLTTYRPAPSDAWQMGQSCPSLRLSLFTGLQSHLSWTFIFQLCTRTAVRMFWES